GDDGTTAAGDGPGPQGWAVRRTARCGIAAGHRGGIVPSRGMDARGAESTAGSCPVRRIGRGTAPRRPGPGRDGASRRRGTGPAPGQSAGGGGGVGAPTGGATRGWVVPERAAVRPSAAAPDDS